MIRNVIFDMGNVLLTFDPEIPLNEFCTSEEEKRIIRKELFRGPEWIRRDMGTISREEELELVSRRVPEQYHEALRHCVYEWTICMRPIAGAQALVSDLIARGYSVYVISNAGEDFYEYFPRFGDMSRFNGILVSADIHMIKPGKEIFEHALRKWDLKAEECLFVDDMADNVKGAESTGMHGLVFAGDYDEVRRMCPAGR